MTVPPLSCLLLHHSSRAVLLPVAGYAFAASARFSAQRRLLAAMIAFLPAAESFRLGFAAFDEPALTPLILAHLAFCASAIAFLPAALIFRRLRFGVSDLALDSAGRPLSNARSSAICSASLSRCDSNPRIAASIIGLVRFCVAMLSASVLRLWNFSTFLMLQHRFVCNVQLRC